MKNEQPKVAFIETVKAAMAIKIKKGDAYYLHVKGTEGFPCVFSGYINEFERYEFLVLKPDDVYVYWAKPIEIEQGQLLSNVYPDPRVLSKQDLINQLDNLENNDDAELAHIRADELLLKYISDARVTAEFEKITKAYS